MAENGKTIHLEVITPDAAVLQEDVSFVLVRALDGDLGIMPNHAPIIASLAIAPILYDKDGQRQCISVAKGFLEMNGNSMTIISPAAELPGQIDVKRAEAAKTRAENRLQHSESGIDVERAKLALSRALCRLDVAEKYSK